MDPASLGRAMGTKTRAIIPVHLYGQCADMDAIEVVAGTQGIPLVEDCAQATGAEFRGRKAGSCGIAGCFSFYPTKNLGALGDGGAVVTSDASRAEELRRLRQYGWSRRYVAKTAGGRNSRLDEMQAAVLRVRLPLLDAGNSRRRDIAQAYAKASSGTRLLTSAGTDDVAHLVVAVPDDRAAFTAALDEAGVGWAVHFPLGDHRQPVALADGGDPPTLPTTEWAGDRVVSLPCFPEMTDDEVERVCDALRRS
jgi:dTDP-4-amino-4,6-dideoxygalactose transaminase